MVIRTGDLDGQALAGLMGQVGATIQKVDPTEAERRAIEAEEARYLPLRQAHRQQMQRQVLWTMGLVLGGLGLTGLASGFMLAMGGDFAQFAWVPGTVAGITGGIGGVWAGFRAAKQSRNMMRQVDRIEHDLLAQWLPLLSLPRLERIYWEAVQVLANDRLSLDEGTGREILVQLNTLLARSRELDLRAQSIRSVLESENPGQLGAERAGIADRLSASTDPIARQALEDSLRMCDERIANVGKLKPAMERLGAQQEAILQTMASIQSSLARWQAAPSIADEPDLGEIHGAVVRINDETHAVEQAVQEVMSLQP